VVQVAVCAQTMRTATNMTDELAALTVLVSVDSPERAEAINAFEAKWSEDQLVMQVRIASCGSLSRLSHGDTEMHRISYDSLCVVCSHRWAVVVFGASALSAGGHPGPRQTADEASR
jgi:hypothetical protein